MRAALAALLLLPGGESRAGQSLGTVNLLSVAPRIVTPDGNGKNDAAFFNFDQPLSGVPISGEIFDVTGAKVGTLSIFGADDTKMTWDARDDEGRTVRSGIYIYRITLGGGRLTGTVVIAK